MDSWIHWIHWVHWIAQYVHKSPGVRVHTGRSIGFGRHSVIRQFASKPRCHSAWARTQKLQWMVTQGADGLEWSSVTLGSANNHPLEP